MSYYLFSYFNADKERELNNFAFFGGWISALRRSRLRHPFAAQHQESLRLVTPCQRLSDLTRDCIEAVLATKPKQFQKVNV